MGKSNLTISYSGDTTGGTLTASNGSSSVNIAIVGDYTNGTFIIGPFNKDNNFVLFNPNPPATSTAHADTFDFSAALTPHVAPETSITHMHGGHGGNEIAFAHDVTEAMDARGPKFDHLVHDLFAHGHAGMAEALF